MKWGQKIREHSQNVLNTMRFAFRGVIKNTKSETDYQSVQIEGLEEERIQDSEQYQQFGFTSHAPAGTKAIILPINGKSSHGVIIATENGSFRVKSLKSGEVCVYSESGAKITLKQNKVIDIDCDELNINTKKYTCKTDTHETTATETITQTSEKGTTITSKKEMMISSQTAMQLSDPNTITLETPQTSINGGLSAGGESGGKATFNIPVDFMRKADFKVPFAANDGVFNGISFIDHLHDDSIGGDTTPPKQQ